MKEFMSNLIYLWKNMSFEQKKIFAEVLSQKKVRVQECINSQWNESKKSL